MERMPKLVLIVAVAVIIGMAVVLSIAHFMSDRDIIGTSFSIAQGNSEDESIFIKPLTVSSCTPSDGYDYCYQNSYYYHGASPYAQIQGTNLRGDSGYGNIDGGYNQYYIDEVYVNIKHVGDRFTVHEGWTDWGDPCGSVGCTGDNVGDGKYVVATAPAKNPKTMFFMSWDKAYSGTYWAWTAVYWGWVQTPATFDFYVIDCFDDSDVPNGYFCDKSGAWDTWTAKPDACAGIDVPNVCDGFDLYSQTCDRTTGDFTKDILIEGNSVECGCYYPDEIPNTCIDYDLYSQAQKTVCVDSGFIPDQLLEVNSIECGYVCTEGESISFTCTDGVPVASSMCSNNVWVTDNYPGQSCPLNWSNIGLIIESYLIQWADIITGWIT